MYQKLFIPGPVNVTEDVLQKMATPMIGHRSKDASVLQKSISQKMKKIMSTNNEILLSTSSGTGLMEGAVRSCTKKRAAIFSVGAFGEKWYEMAVANGVSADLFSSELGKATSPKLVDEVLATGKYDLITITHNETSTGIMNPVEEISKVIKKYPEVVFCLDTVSSMGGVNINIDDLGVDICITSTQKCLGLPPGMSICSISQKAIEAAQNVKNRGFYFDLLKLYEYIQKKDYQYPSTPSLPHMFALDYQLDKILDEGLENRFARHKQMAQCVQQWAKKNFDLFADEAYASYTVTTIKNTKNISVAELNENLSKYGYMISNGYGNLKEKTFRIGHMADTTLKEVQELLAIIEKIIPL
ncbi:pyridoxal-phosphate-dependent aminotransferase family protein [Inediibacterium massiliense]|uniref:pyridoxal-phosphate-dependent aminotransferase family protein n=1 Tax=Inediibacterium massiliense TaxID=1658111 RepID=UPI0006B53A78|nr:alanine--glyoxylate aminotransferase family protein [Inediibacterium massiliense]